MTDILATESNFKSMSIKDLLQARDLYHYHLLNKANVVGTAIGLYLIRNSEPYPKKGEEKKNADDDSVLRGERTFMNAAVRDYSWPCVLVMVNEWAKQSDFGSDHGKLYPDQMVPRILYMPDGRMVPVCVVKVDQKESTYSIPNWKWPVSLFGGGMPIVIRTQEREHRATAGCLVTDGHTTYLLTSRHVCGENDETVFAMAGGRLVPIGQASHNSLTRLPFEEIYPEFQASRTYMNLDVGLIELANVDDWTSQIYGLGQIGPMADLNALNITTRLIEAPVVAAGAASGRLEGRIKALFYRYKSVGGYDYVSDFLIAPRELAGDKKTKPYAQTQPGDSGAVWHLVTRKGGTGHSDHEFQGDLRPIAIEWGGQTYRSNQKESFTFALATSLTTVSRILDVELVQNHNTGVQPFWGQMGHYSIAAFAIQALGGGKLKTFMNANEDRVSFPIANLNSKTIAAGLKTAKAEDDLVPLADVPDIIWKNFKTKLKGGRDDKWGPMFRSTGPEHPTHYADIDELRPSDSKTLRQLCLQNPANISVQFWQQFYDEVGHTEQSKRGLLPFRVWQFFDAMVSFARKKDSAQFLCAAGTVSHYVGDACQPLHGSIYADGYADQPTMVTHHKRETGEEYQTPSHVGAGVHSTYETKMVDRYSDEIIKGVKTHLKDGAALPEIQSGHDAAKAIINLMDRSAKKIKPKQLVDAFIEAGEASTVAVQDALWKQFGDDTTQIMADGARVLARIWEGAWKTGSGAAIPASKLGKVTTKTLIKLYTDITFVESLDLDHIGDVLK